MRNATEVKQADNGLLGEEPRRGGLLGEQGNKRKKKKPEHKQQQQSVEQGELMFYYLGSILYTNTLLHYTLIHRY